jgi:hypothetical protein
MNTPSGVDIRFNQFLHAQIGEEGNGMQLSVLSVLARRNADPWETAGQLAALPRDAAIGQLTAILQHIPAASSGDGVAQDIAVRLAALLPAPRAEAPKFAHVPAVKELIPLILTFILFMLASQLLIAGLAATGTPDKPVTQDTAAAIAPAAIKADP